MTTEDRNLSYTGKIHHGQSTVSSVFFNVGQNEEVLCDEKTNADYIALHVDAAKQEYVSSLLDLQAYKTEHNIELDCLPYDEWKIE